jgi:hypothetical protein
MGKGDYLLTYLTASSLFRPRRFAPANGGVFFVSPRPASAAQVPNWEGEKSPALSAPGREADTGWSAAV